MSSLQEDCLHRLSEIAAEYAFAFRIDAKQCVNVLLPVFHSGQVGRHTSLLASVIVPFKERAETDQGIRTYVYQSLNFVGVQALVNHFLPQTVVDRLIETAAVSLKTSERHFARQIVCDAVAVRLTEERILHPDDGDATFLLSPSERQAVAFGAFFATAELVTRMSEEMLDTIGADKFLRVRLLGEYEEMLLRSPRSQRTVNRMRSSLLKGIKEKIRFTRMVRTLFAHTLMNAHPRMLSRVATFAASAGYLSVVKTVKNTA